MVVEALTAKTSWRSSSSSAQPRASSASSAESERSSESGEAWPSAVGGRVGNAISSGVLTIAGYGGGMVVGSGSGVGVGITRTGRPLRGLHHQLLFRAPRAVLVAQLFKLFLVVPTEEPAATCYVPTPGGAPLASVSAQEQAQEWSHGDRLRQQVQSGSAGAVALRRRLQYPVRRQWGRRGHEHHSNRSNSPWLSPQAPPPCTACRLRGAAVRTPVDGFGREVGDSVLTPRESLVPASVQVQERAQGWSHPESWRMNMVP